MKLETIKIDFNKEIYECLSRHFKKDDPEDHALLGGKKYIDFLVESFIVDNIKIAMKEKAICKFSIPSVMFEEPPPLPSFTAGSKISS